MYAGLHVKCLTFFLVTKIRLCIQICIEVPYITFHEIPFNGSSAV